MFKKKYPNLFKKQHKKRSLFIKKKNLYKFSSKQNKSTNIKFIILSTQNSCILPKNFISFFRKHFRKFLKKKKILCFFKLCVNYIISTKPKNSRMGKGVGSIKRFSFKLKKKQSFLILKNYGIKRANTLAKYLTKRLNTQVSINFIN